MMLSLRGALSVQGRVLYALILREALGKYGKSKLGYLWAFIEPLIQILVLVLVFSELGRESPVGGDLAWFFVTGIVPWFLYHNISHRLSGALGANQALMAYPQVTAMDVLLARAILEMVTLFVVFLALFLGLSVVGRANPVFDGFHILMALGGLSCFSFGIGLINAAIRLHFDSWDKVFSAFNRPLYFVSGVFFSVTSLPYPLKEWLQWNPIFQFVEWHRSGFYQIGRASCRERVCQYV